MKLEVNNNFFSVELDDNGCIEKLFAGKHQWNGYPGYLTVIDELCGRIFHSSNAETTLVEQTGSKLIFERRWSDAEFVVQEIWTAHPDCISWRTEVLLADGCAERSIQVKQLFPYPYPAYKLKVWAANARFPTILEELGGQHLFYGDACYGTLIPAFSIYNENSDVGFTLSKPFGLKSARLSFHFKDYHSDGIEIENSCMHLKPQKTIATEILIHAHEGCWRPGLNWLYEKYPEYFNPPNPKVRELDGGFMITNPYTEDRFLESVGKYKVKWAEIHNHFPKYGLYAPEADRWESVIKHDYPEVELPDERLSKEKINHHLHSLQKNNIKGLLYFQVTGDAYIPYAEECFQDSIARDFAGNLIITWKNCCFLDATPGTSFNKHINQQIDKFLNDYPDIDGVFLDQVCYQTIDTAHSDGITAMNNKPVAMFGFSYEQTLKKLSEALHAQNKILWGNGPFDIEVQKELDGIMAEGSSGISETFKYLCIAKPLLVHTYPETPANVEKMFKYCLLSGASYSIGASSKDPVPPAITPQVQDMFARSIPLVEKVLGCKWLLEPNPLELPDDYQGNIFTSPHDNGIVVTLISPHGSLLHNKDFVERNVSIKVKTSQIENLSRATSFTTHTREKLQTDFRKDDDKIIITLKEHSVMSVVVIK